MHIQHNLGVGLLLFVTSMISISDSQYECTSSKISDCGQPVLRYLNGPTNTRQDLNNICSALPSASRCINSLECSESDTDLVTIWKGPENALTYLCQEDSALDVWFSDPCLKITSRTVQSINQCERQLGTVGSITGDICLAMNTYLKCIENSFSGCGKQATRIYLTFRYKYLKPIATVLNNCNLYEPLSPNVIFSAGVQQTSSILLLVTMLVYYVNI